MAKLRTIYRCTSCAATVSKWVGRCGSCGEWNSLEEFTPAPTTPAGDLPVLDAASLPVPLADLDALSSPPQSTGIGEFDRVLAGGFVPGSVTLVGGEPGIGKSTLLLQTLLGLATAGRTCLLVAAEESVPQVRSRAERLGSLPPSLLIQAETEVPRILAGIEATQPDVCVIDSIQTVADPEVGSSPGSVLQVRECAARLARVAKQRGMVCILVGHVTKDGALAGPRVLEHLVDTVLAFEGERHHSLRMLRALKHRFGPTGELGLFEMVDCGLAGVDDPSGLLLGDRRPGVPGSVVVPAMEGRRPLLVEVQALIAESPLAMPRRSAQGLDSGRLSLVLAVLDRRAGIKLGTSDVYVSAVGGVKIAEPAADLAVALALASAKADVALPGDLVVCGEIGLGGELRQVHQTPRRLMEAARLGFRRAVVPYSSPEGPTGLRLHRACTVSEAVGITTHLATTLQSRDDWGASA